LLVYRQFILSKVLVIITCIGVRLAISLALRSEECGVFFILALLIVVGNALVLLRTATMPSVNNKASFPTKDNNDSHQNAKHD